MSNFQRFYLAHKLLVRSLMLVALAIVTAFLSLGAFQTLKVYMGYPKFIINPVEFRLDKIVGAPGYCPLAHFNVRLPEKALVHVSRELVRSGEPDVFLLPSTDAWMEPVERYVRESSCFPKDLEPGEWCMTYNARYRPTMSLMDRSERHVIACTTIPTGENRKTTAKTDVN